MHSLKAVAAFFIGLLAATPLPARPITFYLGTYTGTSGSKGIYKGSLDDLTGKLGTIKLAAQVDNPSFLALSPDGKYLYAALEEWNLAKVAAFAHGADGALSPLNTKSMVGAGTVHVSLDPGGNDLLAANYNSGSIACFRLAGDGSIGEQSALIPFEGSGPNKDRQTGSHAHSIYASPDGHFVFACDLGTDRVWIFKLATSGTLTPNDPPFASVPPGSGPRHLAFGADGRFVYVANEMGHSVTVFVRNASSGALSTLETVPVLLSDLTAGNVTTAEIVLHPSGKWLYVSNRGMDSISVFAVASDGKLTLNQNISAGVKGPRSFALDPSGRWLIAAGQNDNRVAELQIDPKTGRLSPTSESAQIGSPVCVVFAGK